MATTKSPTITCSSGHSRPASHSVYPCPWYACRSVFEGDSTRSPQVVGVGDETPGAPKGQRIGHVIERQPNVPGREEYRWVVLRTIGKPYRPG